MFQKENRIRGKKTDIWALGVTLFFMLTGGKYPSGDAKDLIDLKEKIIASEIDYSIIQNENAKLLLKSILEKNPEKRATLD